MKYLPLFLFLLISCQQTEGQHSVASVAPPAPPQEVVPGFTNPTGNSIQTRFLPNPGFDRVTSPKISFAAYLQNFPLKPEGTMVYLHTGEEKYSQEVHAAVLDISTGKADLQQCADAVMRLRAEYLWEQGRFAEIHFNFVNGFKADYTRWRKGERIWVKGNKTGWTTGEGETPGRAAFDQYLLKVFMFANTASLEKELTPKELTQIAIGDVLIKGGFPGHAVLVVDKAVNDKTGQVEVLLAQSYMPAQDIHILRNPNRLEGNPWYEVPANGSAFETMEWVFEAGALRSF